MIIKTTYAFDNETVIYCGGDKELLIGCVSDEETGIFIGEQPVVGPAPRIVGPTGGTGSQPGISEGRASTPYYDVIIENVRPRYDQGDIINATIIIINKGDTPDRDANLTYYIFGPERIPYGESREVFEEVPPTCPNATYIFSTDECKYENETVFIPFKSIFNRSIAIPSDAIQGAWAFHVEYETASQPVIKVYKGFRVEGQLVALLRLIILVSFGYIIYTKWQDKKRKAHLYP